MKISPYCCKQSCENRTFHRVIGSTYLCATSKEEFVRVHPITDGTTDKGEPVENHGWLIGIFEQQLLQDVDDHRHRDQGQHPDYAESPY